MTHVPALRAALQDAADRRYGRRRRLRQWGGLALVPVAAACALVVLLGSPGTEEPARPDGKPRTVRITSLPPRPAAAFRIIEAQPMSKQAAAAAFAKTEHTSAHNGRLVRAWAEPGVAGAAVFFTRAGNTWCVATREPAAGDFPGQWAASCEHVSTFRDNGTSLVVGDTYVGVMGPESSPPTYRAPGGTQRRLRVAPGGLVMIQGAPDQARVTISDRTDTIERPRDARYECADGTHHDVRVDHGTPKAFDPCA
jgi:hypothetical protein